MACCGIQTGARLHLILSALLSVMRGKKTNAASSTVILAKAGIQFEFNQKHTMDSRFRGNDGRGLNYNGDFAWF